jgi:ATPase subunit of ABC transporter with duplicated ATPase domains
MSITQNPAVVLADVSFAWPDGTTVFRDLRTTFSLGRTGLIGPNGTGKSTLLGLIAGQLKPTAGTITITERVGYLPQQLTLRTGATAASLLGVRDRLDALRAIESGDTHQRHFDALADDWSVESRARAALDTIGLTDVDLDRTVATLSGGETILTAVAGLRMAGDRIVLLDEPTNDLDRHARHRLYDVISAWQGALIVVSHDRALLELMDDTAELRNRELTLFGGPYSSYHEHLANEQEAAQQALRTAQQALRTEQRQRVEAETRLARRSRYARTDFENKRRPKVIMNQRRTEAQASAGKLRGQLDDKVDAARVAVQQHAERVRRASRIRIDLPDPGLPTARRLAELRDRRGHAFVIQGRERVALTGPN